jgi:hypothetical protein
MPEEFTLKVFFYEQLCAAVAASRRQRSYRSVVTRGDEEPAGFAGIVQVRPTLLRLLEAVTQSHH